MAIECALALVAGAPAGTQRAANARMLTTMKDAIYDFGSGTSHLARRAGKRTMNIAEDIGPKRALIGLAILGAAVGGAFLLARYVRARRAEQLVDIQPADALPGETQSRRDKKGKHIHVNAH